jgi:YHS domain-containing protein
MKKLLVTAAFGLCLGIQCFAQKASVFNTNGTAIHGYDPVAFFTDSKPEKGKEQFSYNWQQVNWLFVNKENLESFKENPEKYAPQYGGYCAYGTADGHKAPTEIDTWTIVGDKLYFNYNKSVKSMWMKDQKQLIEKADKNWPGLKNKE